MGEALSPEEIPQNGVAPHRSGLMSALRQELEYRRARALERVTVILNEERCLLVASLAPVSLGGGVFGLKPIPDIVALPMEDNS